MQRPSRLTMRFSLISLRTVREVRSGFLWLLGCVVFLMGSSPAAQAQGKDGPANPAPAGGVSIRPLVTDRSPLTLSPLVGDVLDFDVNSVGDFVFTSGGNAPALFLRNSQTQRILQTGDRVPGLEPSRVDLIVEPFLNSLGDLTFAADFFHGGLTQRGVFVRTNSGSLQLKVFSTQTAPGTGGEVFGRIVQPVGITDSGDIGIFANLTPSGTLVPARNTLYVLPAGGMPLRVAGPGYPAPGTGGTLNQITALAFNNQGEILFRAAVVGGAGGFGLFEGGGSGVRKVVAHGDPSPLGGTFNVTATATGFFNDAGQVSFTANSAIWLHTPSSGLAPIVVPGMLAPGPVFGFIVGVPNVQALNDAGDIGFLAAVGGSPVSPQAIFRLGPTSGFEVVAYRNQPLPGFPGQSLLNFVLPFSMNESAQVGFLATPSLVPTARGLFTQAPSGPLLFLAQQGQAAPLAGGGTLSLLRLGIAPRTLAGGPGGVVFLADVIDGTAFSGAFVALPGGIAALTSSEDVLPDGSGVGLRTFRVGHSANHVVFRASLTGGRSSIWRHDINTGQNTRLVEEGDTAPGTGGGRITNPSQNSPYVNNSGITAITSRVIGGTASGATAIHLIDAGGTLTKVVANGDIDVATGRTFQNVSLPLVAPQPLNEAGQVVFTATLLGAGPALQGIFVGSASGPPQKIMLTGEPAPTGGTFAAIVGRPNMNQAGQVAFVARTSLGNQGIFLGMPGAPVQKIVAAGDPSPLGGTFVGQFISGPALNDHGEVVFIALTNGGPGGGVFTGTPSGAPQAVAFHGQMAPTGDFFSFPAPRIEALINNQGDVAFRADLSGGATDSGYFLRRAGSGILETVVVQGDAVPGGGTFASISLSINTFVSENFALGASGEFLFFNTFEVDNRLSFGIFSYGADGAVRRVVARGDLAPATGGGTIAGLTQLEGPLVGGRYAFWAPILSGNRTDAIYITK